MRHSKTIDGRDISLPVEIGGLFEGRYEIERIIGEGLTSVVYAARERSLGQRVALKFLVRESVQHGDALEKVRREALAAASFDSEYACRVLEVRTLDNGVPYLVMEYLEGCNLATELNSRTRLPPMEALRYVLEACEPISKAHAAGIIHRDLKLQNLFLVSRADGSRHVKVMDFGVPNVLIDSDANSRSLPMNARALGSLAYKAPEQLDLARDIDARVDVWSLGVVLYELLTGQRPFGGESIAALVHAVLHDAPSAFFSASVIAPDGLESVLHKALSKSLERRFASIEEFVAALAPFAPEGVLESLQIASVRAKAATTSPGSVTIELDESVFAPIADPTTERSGRKRLIAAFAICALLVGGLLFLSRPARQPPAAPPSVAVAASRAPVHAPPASPSPSAPASQARPTPNADDPPPPSAAAPVAQAAPRPRPPPAPVVVWRPAQPAPAAAPPAKPRPAPGVTELPDFGGRR